MKPEFTESLPWNLNNTHHILSPEVLARVLIPTDLQSSAFSSASAAIQDHSLVTRNTKQPQPPPQPPQPQLSLETKQITLPSSFSQKCHAQILPKSPPQSPFAAEDVKSPDFIDKQDSRDQVFDLGNGQFSWASDSYQPSSKRRRTPVAPAPKPYDSKVPRPPNAFIIYHRTKSKQLAATKSTRPGAEERHPSKTVAEMWREESEEVKLRYQREADLALVEHKKKYPFYKYKPQKRDSKNRGKVRDDKPCSTVESDCPSSSKPKVVNSQVPEEHRQQAAMESAFTVFDLTPLESETKSEPPNNTVSSIPQIANNTQIAPESKINEKIEPCQEINTVSNGNAPPVVTNDLKISIDQLPIIDQNSNQSSGLWIEPNVNNTSLYSSPVEEVEQFSFTYPQLQNSQSSALAFPSTTVSSGGNDATSAYVSPSPSPIEQRTSSSFPTNAVTPMQHRMQMFVENEYIFNQILNNQDLINEDAPAYFSEGSANFADQDLKPINMATTPTTGATPAHPLLTPTVEPIEYTPPYEQPLTTTDQSCNINYDQNNWIMTPPSLPTSPTTLDFWQPQLANPFDINSIPTATLRETQRQIERLLQVRENTQKQILRMYEQNAHLYDICNQKDQFQSNFSL